MIFKGGTFGDDGRPESLWADFGESRSDFGEDLPDVSILSAGFASFTVFGLYRCGGDWPDLPSRESLLYFGERLFSRSDDETLE